MYLKRPPSHEATPLERPLDYINLNINVLISTPDERPPLLKGHFSGSKEVASQEGFHCEKCVQINPQSRGLTYKFDWYARINGT